MNIRLEDVDMLTEDELRKLIADTPDLVVDKPARTKEEMAEVVKTYIRGKIGIPTHAEGLKNITVDEEEDPLSTFRKAGFANKEEMLRTLDSIRRDTKGLDTRKRELDEREEQLVKQETILLSREGSLEVKAKEVGKQYAAYQELVARVESQRKQ